MKLDGAIAGKLEGLRRLRLGHAAGDFLLAAQGRIAHQRRGVVDKRFRRVYLVENIDAGMLERLIRADKLAELPAGLQILDGGIETGGGSAGAFRRDQQGADQPIVAPRRGHGGPGQHPVGGDAVQHQVRGAMRVIDHKPRPQRVVGQLVRIHHGEQRLFAAPRRHHDPARARRIRHQPLLAVQPAGAVQRGVRLRRQPVFRFEFGHGCGLPARDRRQHISRRVIFGAPQQLRGEQAGQQGRAHQHPPHAL